MDTNVLHLLQQLSAQKTSSHDAVVFIVVALAPTLAALAAYLKARAAVAGVKEVHLSINSRFDEWLRVERTQGIASGRQQERDSQKTDGKQPTDPAP
jgi:hypothetical protein